jgi:hypothetical protein
VVGAQVCSEVGAACYDFAADRFDTLVAPLT